MDENQTPNPHKQSRFNRFKEEIARELGVHFKVTTKPRKKGLK